jgi:hypothetical protein
MRRKRLVCANSCEIGKTPSSWDLREPRGNSVYAAVSRNDNHRGDGDKRKARHARKMRPWPGSVPRNTPSGSILTFASIAADTFLRMLESKTTSKYWISSGVSDLTFALRFHVKWVANVKSTPRVHAYGNEGKRTVCRKAPAFKRGRRRTRQDQISLGCRDAKALEAFMP